MRDAARVVALLLAVLVILRDDAVAAGAPAMGAVTVIVGFAVLLGVSLWRDGFMTFSGVALAGHYVASLGYGGVVADLGAPVIVALVVAHLDVLDLAASVPRDRRIDRAFLRARLRHLGTVVALSATAAYAVVAVATYRWPDTNLMRIAGLGGVALAVVIPLGLARARR